MDETANSNANELYDPIIEAFDDGIANIVADSRQIPKRFSTLNILEMYSERCFQRGAFREVLSASESWQDAIIGERLQC